MKQILFLITLCISLVASAQTERDHVRRGNRFMRDSLYEKAQVEYQKAIELDNTCTIAHYNLGNAFLYQSKPEEAMKEYETASKMEKDSLRLGHIYHNMGVLLQSAKQLDKALACYKQALRNNPHSDDTRYNYLLCLRQMKNNPDNQDQDKDDQSQDDKKEQDQQQQQQEKQDQKNDQSQQQKEQEQPKPDMSRENAEQMLKAAMQNEKETQEKMQQAQQQPQRKRLQKQW